MIDSVAPFLDLWIYDDGLLPLRWKRLNRGGEMGACSEHCAMYDGLLGARAVKTCIYLEHA